MKEKELGKVGIEGGVTMELRLKADDNVDAGLAELGFDVERQPGEVEIYLQSLGAFELMEKVIGKIKPKDIIEISIGKRGCCWSVIALKDLSDIRAVLVALTWANKRLLEEKEYIKELQKENKEKELKIKELYKEIREKEEIVYNIVHVIPSKYFPYSSYEEE